MGSELGNAYSELNDPILQRKLLELQQKALKKGDEDAQRMDKDFIKALESKDQSLYPNSLCDDVNVLKTLYELEKLS